MEYETYGNVPGNSIDAKELANVYSVPLVIMNGCKNNGNVRIFAAGFLRNQIS